MDMVTDFGDLSIWEIRAVLCKAILPALESNLTPMSYRCTLFEILTHLVRVELFVKDILYNLDVVQKELVLNRIMALGCNTVTKCHEIREKQAELISDELSDILQRLKRLALELIENLLK